MVGSQEAGSSHARITASQQQLQASSQELAAPSLYIHIPSNPIQLALGVPGLQLQDVGPFGGKWLVGHGAEGLQSRSTAIQKSSCCRLRLAPRRPNPSRTRIMIGTGVPKQGMLKPLVQ